MKMNKLIGISVIALSMAAGQAFAACDASTGGADPAVPSSSTPNTPACLQVKQGTFINQDFFYQMSVGVAAATNQSNVAFFVHTEHAKGMYDYGGTSNGGSVSACKSAANTQGYGYTSPTTPSTGGDGCS